ncbi:splicing factor, partial [Tanacetum coccineum]
MNMYHDGIFAPSPIRYLQGELKRITDIDFKGLGIKELKSDSDVEDFLKLGYDNGFMVDLYVEHFGYDVIDLLKYENVAQQFRDSSDDEYSNVDGEDLENVDFYTTGEEDVIIKNLTTHDDFLNRLCSTGGLFRSGVPKPGSSLPNIPEDDPDGSTIEMEPVLGMRYNDPEQLKLALCNYGVAHGYQLWFMKNDWKSLLVFCGKDIQEGRWMYKGVKDGWLAGFRKVIGLDGCFLKHTCKWEFLTAMRRDANNQMYHVAWAVVRVENKENWSWFLSLLHDDLNLNNGNSLTIISDSHKGLLSAVADWLPQLEHRKCTRHLYASLRI